MKYMRDFVRVEIIETRANVKPGDGAAAFTGVSRHGSLRGTKPVPITTDAPEWLKHVLKALPSPLGERFPEIFTH
jgi:hypothetical protein